MDINQSVSALLKKSLKSTPGVQQLILADATGLVMSNVAKKTINKTDFEGIASISVALFCGVGSLNLGALDFVYTVFTNAKLCLLGVTKDYVLISIISKNASIKKVKAKMKQLSTLVSEQLNLLKVSEQIETKQHEMIEKSATVSKDEYDKLLDELSF